MTTARFDRRLLAGTGPLCGRVVAVHDTATVVRLGPGGRLLTLLPPRHWLVPWGIALPDWEARPPEDTPVNLDGSRCSGGGEFEVSLQGNGVDLGIPPRPLSTELLRRQLAALGQLEKPAVSALEQAAIRLARQRLDRTVVTLVGGGDTDSIGHAVRSLVGLGPGSTPTGDDLLVGLAAATARLCGAGVLETERADALREGLRTIPATATTPVSVEMLRHAAEGRFLEPLGQLAIAMGSGSRDAVADAGAALLGVGARSGADLAHGALALARAMIQ